MLAIIITAVIILLSSLATDVTCSTSSRDSVRSDDDSGMLREILQRMDKMQNHLDKVQNHMDKMQNHIDRIERNTMRYDIRFDKLEANVLNMQDNAKNLSVVMDTIVEQQMVITAEIFTVSQTLPFCCCQYQNTTERPEIGTTTIDTGKPEITTPTTLESVPMNCADAMGESGLDGIYQINVTDSNIGPFDVYCMKNVADVENEKDINGTWLVIQRRLDNTTDFYLSWDRYKRGFGNSEGNFWIGLDKLYALTIRQELWIQMDHSNGTKAWALYNHFQIGDETELYALHTLGSYSGTAGDSLSYHRGAKWTSYDRDNDNDYTDNCASKHNGAWWYNYCSHCNLNGMYGNNNYGGGITWRTFNGYSNSLKYVHMAIRPRQ